MLSGQCSWKAGFFGVSLELQGGSQGLQLPSGRMCILTTLKHQNGFDGAEQHQAYPLVWVFSSVEGNLQWTAMLGQGESGRLTPSAAAAAEVTSQPTCYLSMNMQKLCKGIHHLPSGGEKGSIPLLDLSARVDLYMKAAALLQDIHSNLFWITTMQHVVFSLPLKYTNKAEEQTGRANCSTTEHETLWLWIPRVTPILECVFGGFLTNKYFDKELLRERPRWAHKIIKEKEKLKLQLGKFGVERLWMQQNAVKNFWQQLHQVG